MEEISSEKKSGCSLFHAVFGRRNKWPRKQSSARSDTKTESRHQRANGIAVRPNEFQGSPKEETNQCQAGQIVSRRSTNYSRTESVYQDPPHQSRAEKPIQAGQQAWKSPQAVLGLSGELRELDSLLMAEYQESKATGNVAVFGNLGNLRQQPENAFDYLPGNINDDTHLSVKSVRYGPEKSEGLCRALSTRTDPEKLKILGNEDYKNGKFAEAVAMYDAAISINPNKASYRSNKSAALTAMGKLLDAAFECREAIRIDPYYQRAHNRLATLYVRLGEVERALYHFKQAGAEADPDAMNKANQVQNHLNRCTQAKRKGDWNTLIKQTNLSIAAGSDSAPLIFALKAEALMKLNRHQEAIQIMAEGPHLQIDDCTKFFGPIASASLLVVHAQVDMIEGRFDDAVAAAQRASRLDVNNREVSMVFRKTKAVAMARSNGNEQFKEGRYSEACNSYGEGLIHDTHNAVLLANRAACRCKLNQYDKALEDCNTALGVRPGYSKARLRRANCYAKMGNWRVCLQDCEVLIRENPGNEEAGRLLREAKAKLEA